MNATPPPGTASVNALLIGGRHGEGFAEALAFFAEARGSGEAAQALANAALCAERAEEAIPLLETHRRSLDPVLFARLRVMLALACGDFGTARAEADALAWTPAATPDRLAMLIAVAERAGTLDVAVALMREREATTANYPFEWLRQRWEAQCRLGRHAAVIEETTRIAAHIPAQFAIERRATMMTQAEARLAALRFDEAAAQSLALAGEFVEGADLPRPVQPIARPGTRQRQRRLAADIERLVLAEQLPVVIVAGTLLGLVRDGDFHAHDQDLDLGAVPPATSADVAERLLATGLFHPDPRAVDYGTFRALKHVPTGLAVDVIEYRRVGDRFVSTWQHPGGTILRRSAVPAFAVTPVFHAGIQRRLPFPDRAEAVLSATYGDWRKPDPHFDTVVSSPAILERTDYLRSIAALRLADALIAGRRGIALHLARHLCDIGVAAEAMERLIARLATPSDAGDPP